MCQDSNTYGSKRSVILVHGDGDIYAHTHVYYILFIFAAQIVLPTLSKLLGDTQAEVRQAAGESLVGVAALMKPLDLGHHVLTIVLQLAHDDEQVRSSTVCKAQL